MVQDTLDESEKTYSVNNIEFSPELLRECWFLAGPTASGKSAVALQLAQELDAEIIALDSMTIYQGMDIGTAKPTLEEQRIVKHHLFDIIAPHTEYSIARYLQDAKNICEEILARNKKPFFVGGTGLYLKAILRGMSTGPASDEKFRLRYLQQWQTAPEIVYAELKLKDPVSASRLHINDSKRIIRALEVYELTGTPLSSMQGHQAKPLTDRSQHVYWIDPPRTWLYDRINLRVEHMLSAGLINEVQQLLSNPQGLSSTARQGLGYKEVADYLQVEPELNDLKRYAEMVNQIQTRTRQFAKRQHTWFRNLEECIPLKIHGHETPAQICKLILKLANA
jgi:tRNA dimethylallyltransferase